MTIIDLILLLILGATPFVAWEHKRARWSTWAFWPCWIITVLATAAYSMMTAVNSGYDRIALLYWVTTLVSLGIHHFAPTK